jgi:hypothetical protein
VVLGAGLLVTAGCKSAHVEVTVENQTGAEVRLLEVDYPNASFGFDKIAPGGSKHYRIQVEGTGNVKVQYTGVNEKQFQSTGPELEKDRQGTLKIVLEPNGKAEFVKNK